MKRAGDFWRWFELAAKRLFDMVVSGVLLIALGPVIGLIGWLVKRDSPGPAIYRHERIGKDGKPFSVYKFRSMSVGGDDRGYLEYLKQLIESEQAGDGNGTPYRKMEGDGRITKVGRVLRKYYLDELPQLLNVLRGEMSLVGPRPHVAFEVGYYSAQQRRRLSVRPGLTGLWQVDGKADCSFNELIALDLEYIDRWSVGLDLQILLRTALLMGRGGEEFWARMAKSAPRRGSWRRRAPTGSGPAAEAGRAAVRSALAMRNDPGD
jgi:lipopolysaccharide/colanic/teichoic acid biosynthesis glycosyltransferase